MSAKADRISRAADRMIWRPALAGDQSRPTAGAPLVTLRMRWHGEQPAVGDWITNESDRGRAAWRIVELPEAGLASREYRPILCERYARHEIPDGARVHFMAWDKRKRGA